MSKQSGPTEGFFNVDSTGSVFFLGEYPNQESIYSYSSSQEPVKNNREAEITDPTAILTIGAVVVAGLLPHVIHSVHNRRNMNTNSQK